jgi:threonine dehydratase
MAVTLEDVRAASQRIQELARRTPVEHSRLFDAASGAAS